MPVFGLLGFGLFFLLTLLENPLDRRKWAVPCGALIAAGGVVLFALQAFVIGAFCQLCVVVDVAALGIGLALYQLRGDGWERASYEENSLMSVVDPDLLFSEGQLVRGVWSEDSRIYTPPTPLVRPLPKEPLRLHRLTWLVLAALAVLGPWLYPRVAQRTEVAPAIAGVYRPGKINVLEFFDYQCPHCRVLGPRLHSVLEKYGDKVHLVRGYIPLPHHPQGRVAARVAICAEEQGNDAVAQAFFTEEDFELETLKKRALELGVDAGKLEECLASERPELRFEQDLSRLREAGFEGLPTTYVGATRILGAAPEQEYEQAIQQVLEGKGSSGLAPGVYWSLFAAVFAAVTVLGRKRAPRTKLANP